MPYVALDRAIAADAPVTTVGDPVPDNGMTLEDMSNELNALLVGRTDVNPSRRKMYVNMAYEDMTTSLVIDELQASIEFPVVADQFLYRVPNAVFTITGAAFHGTDETTGQGGGPLDQVDLGVFRGYPILSERPRCFFRFSDMIVLWPTPNVAGTMVVDFRIRPTWMTEDTMCPILYTEWDEGILLLARQKLLYALQEFEASMAANNDYINFIRRKLDVRSEEDKNKIVRSSVPRTSQQVRQPRIPSRRIW